MHKDGDDDEEKESDNLLVQASSRLSHAMLQVPSVDETVAYWKDTASGQVTTSSQLDDGDGLRSAFLALGNGKTTEDCFALELVKNKNKEFNLGNAISYIGVSKLVRFQTTKEDLIGVISGTAPNKLGENEEPNGIPVRSSAAAPGDFFARFCLHTNLKDLEATTQFYTDMLGMSVAAIDEKMVCLRYGASTKKPTKDSKKSSGVYGVPTTLVFEPMKDKIESGNCFDHLVIVTKANVDDVYQQLQQSLEESDLNCPLFMKPTEMFGSKVFGVMDPNGYKIVLAGKV